MVIFDTNIVIDHLRQYIKQSHFVSFIEFKPHELRGLSIISIQELYQGKSTLVKDKEQYLFTTINQLTILPYTIKVAQLAGAITRDLKRSISFPDAAIAATAIINDAELFTLNRKDFEGIKGLELFNLNP